MNPSYPKFSFVTSPAKTNASLGESHFARLAELSTPHGKVPTPNFIFCATKASIKAVPSHVLAKLGIDFILANTYHLLLSPGSKLIEEQGGLHKFMHFDGVMFSDSGGYQIFAMGHGSVSEEIKRKQKSYGSASLIKINETGAIFRSFINGEKILLSPEISIEVQRQLGADLIVQLDECTPYHVDKSYTQQSMEMSLRWGKRSLQEFERKNNHQQALYRVIQGGVYPDLRRISVKESLEDNFFATAIGGSLGKEKSEMFDVVALTMEELRKSQKYKSEPVHLLGIGKVRDIFWGVKQGIDTFDCVAPTRMARHGSVLVPTRLDEKGTINLKNSRFKNDPSPLFKYLSTFGDDIDLEDSIKPYFDYSMAYLHHLLKVREMVALEILTTFNLFQMKRLFKQIQSSLKEGNFLDLEKYWC